MRLKWEGALWILHLGSNHIDQYKFIKNHQAVWLRLVHHMYFTEPMLMLNLLNPENEILRDYK